MQMDFISLNIKHLVTKENLSKDAFGKLFGLNRGAISSYIDEKSKPKIETLQKISAYFNYNLDQLVNEDISKLKNLEHDLMKNENLEFKSSSKLELLEKMNDRQAKIIDHYLTETTTLHNIIKDNNISIDLLINKIENLRIQLDEAKSISNNDKSIG